MHTSTSEVYGTARVAPIPETHPLQAQSPYSASKIAGDKMAESYHLSFQTPVVTLRPFNTFGPRQSARAVISTIISQVAAGKTEIPLGSLDPTRDFTFVTDTANAFATLGNAPAGDVIGRTFNSGSNQEISIKDLVLTIAEVMRLLADTTQLRSVTDWKPAVSLKEGLRRTAEWFTDPANLARYKTDIYNV